MKSLILFSIFSICSFTLSAQNFLWAEKGGTASGADRTSSGNINISIDVDGNIYSKGLFSGTVDFDSGSGVFNLTSEDEYPNTYILKIDIDGNFVWARNIKTDFAAGEIEVDNSGTTYLNGMFHGTVDFDPGSDVFNLISDGSKGFNLKLNNETLGIIERNLVDLTVYPNPSNGDFTIDLGKEYNNVTVQIFNFLGQLISSEKYAFAKNIQQEINGPAGIYFVKISTANEGSSTLKVIKK